MKISNLILAISAMGFMASAQAMTTYDTTGSFTSISISGPLGITASYDPVQPTVKGRATLDTWFENGQFFIRDFYVETEYHNLNLSGPNGTTAIASFPNDTLKLNFNGSLNNFHYDNPTRTLTAHFSVGDYISNNFFCTGAVSLCSKVYSPYKPNTTLDMALVFDTDYKNFAGTGTVVRALSNGTVITEQFSIAGAPPTYVPVPAAGWLLGSGIVGLGGLMRRRTRQAPAA